MIDLGSIYHNPVIEEGYYYVKVIDVQTEPYKDCVMPAVQVRLQPHPEADLPKGLTLSAVIYPTEKAKYFMMNFLNTFLENEETDVAKVLHRWGRIEVYTARYGETEYSAVKWIYQLPAVKEIIAQIYEEERILQRYRRNTTSKQS